MAFHDNESGRSGKAICGLGRQFDAFGFARNLVREIDLCFCAAFEIRVQKIHATYSNQFR